MIKNKLKNLLSSIFIKNITEKVIALLLSIIIYSFIFGEKNIEMGFVVPLQIENLPGNFTITNPILDTVDIRVNGPQTILSGLSPKDFRVSIDLKDIPSGKAKVRLSETNFDIPRGVNVVRISPREIELNVERVLEKEVQVAPDFKGNPADGYEIEEVIITPPRLKVEGPESEINSMVEISTEPIDLSGLEGNYMTTVRPKTSFIHVKYPVEKPIRVEVRIRVRMAKKTLKVKLKAINCSYEVSIAPSRVDITLEGPAPIIAKLQSSEVETIVDLKGLGPGIYKGVSYFINPPSDVYPILFNPDKVDVTIK